MITPEKKIEIDKLQKDNEIKFAEIKKQEDKIFHKKIILVLKIVSSIIILFFLFKISNIYYSFLKRKINNKINGIENNENFKEIKNNYNYFLNEDEIKNKIEILKNTVLNKDNLKDFGIELQKYFSNFNILNSKNFKNDMNMLNDYILFLNKLIKSKYKLYILNILFNLKYTKEELSSKILLNKNLIDEFTMISQNIQNIHNKEEIFIKELLEISKINMNVLSNFNANTLNNEEKITLSKRYKSLNLTKNLMEENIKLINIKSKQIDNEIENLNNFNYLFLPSLNINLIKS
jgi:hypothetical protein